MLRRVCLGITVAALTLTPVAATAASATRTVSSSGTVDAAIVSTVNGKVVVAGYVKDTKYATGSVLFNEVKAGKGVSTPFTVFFTGGSLTGTAVFDSEIGADGTGPVSNGKLTIKRGGGTFKGATGTGTVEGQSLGEGKFKLTYTYKIKLKG